MLINVLIALDQLINTLLGGSPDETLSARAYRGRYRRARWHIAWLLIDALFFWEPCHCELAWRNELNRRHMPKDYQRKGSI